MILKKPFSLKNWISSFSIIKSNFETKDLSNFSTISSFLSLPKFGNKYSLDISLKKECVCLKKFLSIIINIFF